MFLTLKLKALIYEHFVYFAAHISISLHLHISSIMKFNRLNFSKWSEQVQFHLGILDLDLTLTISKPAAINDASSTEQRLTIPKIDSTKEIMKFVEDHSHSDFANKSFAGTRMGMFTTMTFDGSRTIHEHVIEITNITTILGSMGLKVSDNFLMQFIIKFLPPTYSQFQIN
ncbi:hypothetical protein Pfo_021784 [Paulownia fortunei]|nr:hypothetical protein Pfo_021784 [Paulownia fortunei]